MVELKLDEGEPEKIKPKYISRKGFVTVNVKRGFTEIAPVYNLLRYEIEREECFICGGYVRYMCSPIRNPITAGDLDIYFNSNETYEKCKDKFLRKGFTIKYENDVSLGFKILDDQKSAYAYCPPIQLIKPILEGAIVATGSMETIIKNFDFTVIRCGLISSTTAKVDADFMHDEENKILRIKNIHCPISSTLRCMKYAKKGYWLPPMQCCRLFIDWEERDEEYRIKIIEFLKEADKGEGMTKEQIDEMERLMRID